MQQVDDPPLLPVGTEVSAKYKGAFCEAKVSKVVRNIKVKVVFKHGLGTSIVTDDAIKSLLGHLRIGAAVEVRHPERKELVDATILKIQDCSQYTVVFDDGDITTLRRTALCLKSGRHFNESETLDQLPLTHPEHFGNPVVGGRRGRRRGQLNEGSSEEGDESDAKEVVNEKEENIGKVVLVETESKKKDKEKWFPALIVAPSAQNTHSCQGRIRVKDDYIVRSFKDDRYYTVPKTEAIEFKPDKVANHDNPAVQAALEYIDSDKLPALWDRTEIFGNNNSSSEDEGEIDSDSSDDEPREDKDRFVAHLYKFMDDRGTPLNKVPSIQNRDVDLYRLFRTVHKRGGYNRVTAQNQWKSITSRLGFTPVTVSVTNLVKQAFKKFLQPYGEFQRKLGCSLLMSPRNSNRSKGRSLVRANTVASPKPGDKELPNPVKTTTATTTLITTPTASVTTTPVSISSLISSATIATQSGTEESENTSESSLDTLKKKRKASVSSNKVKTLVEKYEEKTIKDEADVPLAKIKAGVVSKDKEKEIPLKDMSGPGSGHATRESSPAGPSVSAKKDKTQKKPIPLPDDKKVIKRKKDEVVVEKVETAGDFVLEVGDKLKVYYHEKKVTYEAKIIEINYQRGTPMYLVHYTGWNTRYDEWVPRERIAENLSKGSKHKGRSLSTENKQKENPPKPPTAASLAASSLSGNLSLSSSSTSSAKTLTTGKRGRGRSDSNPPRSTTPSSVASNSSRTKSPAASSLKKRPTRTVTNTIRRTSANVSDVSMASESDTDSDEPVRRPTRAAKLGGIINKIPKVKKSASAANSQSESDDDDSTTSRLRTRSGSTSNVGSKGRDYDLNQIRSELKGFQRIKSSSPVGVDGTSTDTKESLTKTETEYEFKTIKLEGGGTISTKEDSKIPKSVIKEEPTKSFSTDISSETDSFGDDDSQSSDKTTTLENMTKKFQLKIHADKQRAMEKTHGGKLSMERTPLSKARIVEKIIKDSLAEKHQESLKVKPVIKDDQQKIKKIDSDIQKSSMLIEIGRKVIGELKEEEKKSILQVTDTKASLIAPARFNTNINVNKHSSVIVEKPLNVIKKQVESVGIKITDILKKSTESSLPVLVPTKKFVEPHRESIKLDQTAAGSPSSTSSSSSSSSMSTSSRSLPDMSKLDISGSSSSLSSFVSVNKESKFSSVITKPNSPDIYEFKDPEPFEFEMRKPPATSSSSLCSSNPQPSTTSTLNTSCNIPSTSSSRKQTQKLSLQHNVEQPTPQSSAPSVTNRKKRISPLKEAPEKPKQQKLEEKSNTIISEPKLSHAIPSTASINVTGPIISTQNKTSPIQNKPVTVNPLVSSSNMLAPPSPSPTILVTPQKSDTGVSVHTPFDVLRKSPSFNLNIHALNEELAQTVQETTRALTDALQTPQTPTAIETPLTKSEPISVIAKGSTQSPKLSTLTKTPSPSSGKVGSPFIETRKDLSNVFELTTSEGSSSNNENKDNKCELENMKILLSGSAGEFNMKPEKYENKPTSIADKVLKAISQKKEEVENKSKDIKNDLEKESSDETSTIRESQMVSASPEPKRNLSEVTGVKSSNFLTEPLQINTDLSTISSSLLSSGSKKESINILEKLTPPTSLSKRTPLTSPEPKLGILESMPVKNTDLSETIQKLECAIQRRTPVACIQLETASSSGAGNFSDDSMDSTDSERRLVIEDVVDDSTDTKKNSPVVLHSDPKNISTAAPTQIESSLNKQLSLAHTSQPVQTPVPVKAVASASRSQSIAGSSVPMNIIAKGSSNSNSTSLLMKSNTTGQQSTTNHTKLIHQTHLVQHTLPTPFIQAASTNIVKQSSVTESKISDVILTSITSPKTTQFTQNPTPSAGTQRPSIVVPIELPDIPASVVVASGAVASVVAAAHAAVAATTTPKNSPLKPTQSSISKYVPLSTTPKPSTSSTIQVSLKAFENSNVDQTMPTTLVRPQISSTLVPSSSGFYLNPRMELLPDDGVKPIPDSTFHNKILEMSSNSKTISMDINDDVSSMNPGVSDVQADSINLLCEETIPGSPAPAFGGKEEPILSNTSQRSGSLLNEDENKITLVTSSVQSKNATSATSSMSQHNINSSPNDSASQDESSEDIKKNIDIENEISPRKRKKTRKSSEMVLEQQSSNKRRRNLSGAKKNTAGSDSDDNSDSISQRSTILGRPQNVLPPQLLQQQQSQPPLQSTKSGNLPCPYNFLVYLDDSLGLENQISLIMKQMQGVREAHGAVRAELISIDRRRKKLRRREREKKQIQMQNQQQLKMTS